MNFHQRGGGGAGPWGSPREPEPRFGRRLLVLAGIVALCFFALFYAFPPAFRRESDEMLMVQYGLIGTVMLMSLAASRKSLAVIAGQLAIWALLALFIVALYGYRYELGDVGRRVMAELVPTRGVESQSGAMTFTRSTDQQFWIDALVDEVPIRFLVDTGASSVVLNREDAARLGFPASSLSFTQVFETANGRTRGAPVRLKEIRIGQIRFSDVQASVNEGELRHSLLGMHLLEQLSSIEIRKDRLIIRQ
ncbi:MAG: TIGR02281 family clan AA aspartic protease [Hyphomicrobiales bacterium]